ncbi:MAG: hypothetical protein ACRCT8_02870 [Lacipirellulaceae bacterium]
MNQRKSFVRKVTYGVLIAALLFPLSLLSAPATIDSPGGVLAKLRTENRLGQGDLGEVDPASETIKLATLGLRGLAVNLLWEKATHYKKVEDWTNLAATLEQLAKLQPNFVTFWKYQSWNLSYNVSVEFDDYNDRYYWVRRGIEFLEQGTRFNRDNPALLAELGWVLGQKIGRSDEKLQYRRLFKSDDEYHPVDRPPADRDNWLCGKVENLNAIAAVDEKGRDLGKKSPAVFYSAPSKSQMSYSEAIEEEGLFQKGVAAWAKAEREWVDFGRYPIEHSTGPLLRLGEEADLTSRVEELGKRLRGMMAGIEEKVAAENRALLTKEEAEAIDTAAEKRTDAQNELIYPANEKLAVTGDKLAAAIGKESPDKQREASEVAADLRDAERLLSFTRNYKSTTNYDYWLLRTQFEQSAEAVAARELTFRAQRAFKEDADPITAKELYDDSFQRWAKVFEKFPALYDTEGTTGDDVMVYVYEYGKVLDQLDEEIPADFPLWKIIEDFDSEQTFVEQLTARRATLGLNPDGTKPAEGEQPQAADPAPTTPE